MTLVLNLIIPAYKGGWPIRLYQASEIRPHHFDGTTEGELMDQFELGSYWHR